MKPGYSGVIVVDPGDKELSELITYLVDNKLNVEYVIFTHEHFDHIAGGQLLKEKYNCKLIAGEECSLAVLNPKKNFSVFYGGKPYVSPPIDLTIEELDYSLMWNSCEIKFLNTPGHSKGSVSFVIENFFFTGDTLMKDIKTMTTLPGGSKQLLRKSLDLIINMCNQETLIFPGHKEIFRFEHVDIKKILG